MWGEVQLGAVGEKPTVASSVEADQSRFVFHPATWVEQPRQISRRMHGGSLIIDFGGTKEVVADFVPRPLWGLNDGTPFTILDARMRIGDSRAGSPLQRYESNKILFGAHVLGLQELANGLRVSFTVAHGGWMDNQQFALQDGSTLEPWLHGEHPGLTLRLEEPQPIDDLTQRMTASFTAMLSLWADRPIDLASVEVHLPHHGWCPVQSARPAPESQWSRLLPLGKLDLPTIAHWTQIRKKLGTIPFVATQRSLPQQSEALILAASLESFHRRLHPSSPRLLELSKKDLKLARQAASKAAAATLKHRVDEKTVVEIYSTALSQINSPSFSERLAPLASQVHQVAPGLLGPDPSEWAQVLKKIRNVQAHGLDRHDLFTEDHISEYYVACHSARWALKILLLLQITDAKELTRELRHANRFEHVLANIDREGFWPNFSAYDTFFRPPSPGSEE